MPVTSMPRFEDSPPQANQRRRIRPFILQWILPWLIGSLLLAPASANAAAPRERKAGAGISYFNDVVPDVPWSIHVVKVERAQADLQLAPTLGRGTAQGLSTLSEQVRALPRTNGTPVVAVNGDFYQTEGGAAAGDPR